MCFWSRQAADIIFKSAPSTYRMKLASLSSIGEMAILMSSHSSVIRNQSMAWRFAATACRTRNSLYLILSGEPPVCFFARLPCRVFFLGGQWAWEPGLFCMGEAARGCLVGELVEEYGDGDRGRTGGHPAVSLRGTAAMRCRIWCLSRCRRRRTTTGGSVRAV